MKNYKLLFIYVIICYSGFGRYCFSQCNNVALGKPATASNVWNSQSTANFAFDGDCSTAWNAGMYMPQWIQVDLQGTYTINNINLRVNMNPNGTCLHNIYTAPNIGGPWTLVDTISGYIAYPSVLQRCYNPPLANVGAVKVETTTSPSWVAWFEIGVFSVSPTSATITPTGPLTFCQGDSVILTAAAGPSYLWTPGGQTTQSITVNTSGLYKVRVGSISDPCIGGTTACALCGVGTDSVTVTVIPKPVAAISGNATICLGTGTTLTATGGGTYVWGTGDTTSAITVSPSGTTTYSVVVVSAGSGCLDTAAYTVTVNSIATASISGNGTICLGDSTTLTASGGGTYFWNTGANSAAITVAPASTATYNVIVGAGGCTDTAQKTVIVNPLPQIHMPDVSLCDYAAYSLDAGVSGGSYTWSTGASTQSIDITGEGKYWVTVNKNNCIASDTATLTGGLGGGTLFFPNTFTPNSDGLNDYFTGTGNDITAFHLTIFDRWGERIFETESQQPGWNGSYKGNLVQAGIYVWTVDYKTFCNNDKEIKKEGYVLILK